MAIRQPVLERGRASVQRPAQQVRAEAQAGRGWYALLARTGLVAKGVSYGIVGILAIQLALGDG
ncbi:MAG TPA: hypothetical protein VE596_02160, partial [Gaiellaceae bacterium]|nr:hypothetical protein [Gaiellaceae bacterium]